MNTLLEVSPRMRYHTDLRAVFTALGQAQRAYDWLVTDLDCHAPRGGLLPSPLRGDRSAAVVVSGDALSAWVEAQDIQFVWAVLSAFAPGEAPDPDGVDPYPYADGNAALWRLGAAIQHPRAEAEIVCFDSSATLLLARDPDLVRRFRAYFPEAVDLDEYNAAHAAGAAQRDGV